MSKTPTPPGVHHLAGEVTRDATVAGFATVQAEGEREVQRETEHYNLDVIITSKTKQLGRAIKGPRK